MIDDPGPWGTGPFTLVKGHSRLDTEPAPIGVGGGDGDSPPYAATWLWREERTARLRLAANPNYWDARRGPRLREVVLRSDLTPERALELVCTTEGEVDLLTEVRPADAERVEQSEHARLVSVAAMRAVFGVIARDAEGLPLADRRARQALNLAVDRRALVRDVAHGRARPLASLTPPNALTAAQLLPDRLRPYPYDPRRAARLWQAAGGRAGLRPLRLAAPRALEPVVRAVAAALHRALGVETAITVHDREQMREVRRQLAARARPRAWDVLLLEQATQTADAPTLELHHAVCGVRGEYRAGPELPGFEAHWGRLLGATSQLAQTRANNRLDRYVRDEALALFLYAPQALYAVNRHVHFTPYATTFELADTSVGAQHWSRRDAPGH